MVLTGLISDILVFITPESHLKSSTKFGRKYTLILAVLHVYITLNKQFM